jgi:hypothetical protein
MARAAKALRLDGEDEGIQLGSSVFVGGALAEIAAIIGDDLLDRRDVLP